VADACSSKRARSVIVRADDPAVGVLRDAHHAVIARREEVRQQEPTSTRSPADLSAVSGVDTIHDPYLEPA
jgi:hypothetical protein